MRKYIELTEYDNNGRTVIFADNIQGLCRVRDGEYNKEFTEVMVSGYTFIVNEPIDEILMAIKALEQSNYNSIKSELNGDMISRQAVKEQMIKYGFHAPDMTVTESVEDLPSVNSTKTGHCKDCKWWRDSDGLYRRGCHAESQCPINSREVFEGNGYCYMFEPQERSYEE